MHPDQDIHSTPELLEFDLQVCVVCYIPEVHLKQKRPTRQYGGLSYDRLILNRLLIIAI